MDRPLSSDVTRRRALRNIAGGAMALAGFVALFGWAPHWFRPALSRADLRTAVVDAGPVEATVSASGVVVPEFEKVLASPLDARVVKILRMLIESYLKRTDGEFWKMLDFRFLEGGPFTSQDERDRNFVAVINDATRRKFFGNQSALGKHVEADGQRYRVVGVVENVPYFRLTPFADICVPISTNKTDDYKKQFFGGFMATLLARRPEEVKKIQVEFREMLPRVENPDPRRFDVVRGSPDNLIGLLSRLVFNRARDITESHTAKLMAWLTGFAVLFMVLPAINLMNINVSRIVERASEIGVRKAFGATSRSLVAQFVVENVLLTLIGGALGLVFSLLVLHTLEAIEVVRYAQFRMNYRVFAAGFAMTLFFGVFSGVYPAWKMSRLHPVEALKGAAL